MQILENRERLRDVKKIGKLRNLNQNQKLETKRNQNQNQI